MSQSPKVVDYAVVYGYCAGYYLDNNNFMKDVKEYIDRGFEPLGKIVFIPTYNKCVQTLVKKK